MSAYKWYLRPKTVLVHLKTQYISRKESLRTESSATLTFRVGTGGRTNIREREKELKPRECGFRKSRKEVFGRREWSTVSTH